MATLKIKGRSGQKNRFGGSSALSVMPFGLSTTKGVSPAVQAFQVNPGIWGLIDKIAKRVASVEWVALERSTARQNYLGPRAATKAAVRDRGFTHRNADDLVESGDYKLVEGPSLFLNAWQAGNEWMSPFEIRYTLVANYLLAGEVYLFSVDSAAGTPLQYYPFPPGRVSRREGPRGSRFYDAIDGTDVQFRSIPEQDVFPWRAIAPHSPYSTVAGLGGALASEISADELAAQVIRARFSNSGTPPGFFVVKSATSDQLDELRDIWQQRTAASEAGKPLWLDDDIAWVPVGESFNDLAVQNQRNELRKTMRQAAGVPPEIMGDVDNSNRATSAEAERIMARSVVTPILEAMADFLNRKPRQAAGSSDFLSFVDPTPDDEENRITLMTQLPEIFTVNSMLAAASLPPLEGEYAEEGNKLYRDFQGRNEPEGILPALAPFMSLDPESEDEESEEEEDENET